MAKINKKYVLVGALCWTVAIIIKGILDEKNAPTIMYSLAWAPIIINFVYDYIYIYKRIRK